MVLSAGIGFMGQAAQQAAPKPKSGSGLPQSKEEDCRGLAEVGEEVLVGGF
jgi:hypothetical protein